MTDSRIVRVRGGKVEPTGSWVYLWVDERDGSVVYVGATSYDPELRTHLHLASDDPALARIREHVPDADERDLDVHSFPLPTAVSRSAVRDILFEHWRGRTVQDPADAHAELRASVRLATEQVLEQE